LNKPMNSAGAEFTITNAASEAERRGNRRTILLRLLVATVFVIASLWLIVAALRSEEFLRGYTRFSVNASAFTATFFALFPFSFAEVFVFAFCLFFLTLLVLFVRKLIVRPRRMMTALRFVSLLLVAASVVFFLFVSMWGLSYLSSPLSEKLGLEIGKTSAGELSAAALTSLKYANYYSEKVPRDENGACSFGSFSDMANRAREAEIGLMHRFDVLKAPYCPPPKAVMASKLMSHFGITGIYFPFTGESNVNTDYVTSGIPFVMTHELSHRLGTGPEDEANFLAFLACTGSGSPDFVYSGYLNAYIYTINKVYALSPEAAQKIIASQSDKVTLDIKTLNDYVLKYAGPVSDVGDRINDTYLRSMGQADGVQSYGRMVDLLIAYYSSPLFSDNLPQ